MPQAKIIVGANLGDEGKGLTTDYFAYQTHDSVVVRFNGGSQAGHTVQTPDGKAHVFHHFGSGTLADVTTFLSKYFVVNPTMFTIEHEELIKLNCPLRVYLDCHAPLTTPYDMMINWSIEAMRGSGRHGSCGFGINETIERNLVGVGTFKDLITTALDILDLDELRAKLVVIRDVYMPLRLQKLGVQVDFPEEDMSDVVIDKYLKHCEFLANHVILKDDAKCVKDYDNIVFEGAQGLLLDEKHKWFPHVTRSRTGVHNAVEILKEIDIYEAQVYYVTRGYLTRHGAGPLPYEVPYKIYEDIVDTTNIGNQFQGELRFAPLNLDLLKESITNDLQPITAVNLTPNLVITCVNHLPEQIRYVKSGIILENEFQVFARAVKGVYKFDKVLLSKGCTRASFSKL